MQAGFQVVDKGQRAKLDYFVMRTLLVPFILIVAVTAAGQIQRPAPKVGDKAPDFSLPNPDGKPVGLKDYTTRGPVVVIFYRGFW